jgi:hypothetical protein
MVYIRNGTAGHWVRHNTPAGRGSSSRIGRLLIDAVLFLVTFGVLVGYAMTHGAWR